MSAGIPTLAVKLPTTGDVVDGKYVLERLLGQGGMGAVYAARHRKLGHAVAIKLMLADPGNQEATSRFLNEGKAAANIQNEHVVRVFDVDEENGYAYMVLELLDGEDLAQVLERERRLSPTIAVTYILQALEGVRQAHGQGIVHRDLKPSNLFLAKRPNGSSVVKVLDFGISKANSSNPLGATPGALTSTKAMLGSPLYMSPEQLRSSKSVDARADIWAIGVILYELMTGRLPFMGENLGELFAQILEVEAPPLRTYATDAPLALEAIVARCLQRKPEHRFQSVADLERELGPLAGSASAATFATNMMAPAGMPQTAMMNTPQVGQQVGQQLGHHQTPGHGSGSHPGYGAPPPPAGFVQTPQGGYGPPPGYPGPARPPMPSQPGSITGSGAHAPVVKGTMAFGPNTPPPNAMTDSAWQNTGSGAGMPSRAPTMTIVLSAFAFLTVVGLGFAGWSLTKGKHVTQPPPTDSAIASSTVAAPLPALPSAPTATATVVAAETATATASASASASATATSAAGLGVPPQVPPQGRRPPQVPHPPDPPPQRPPDTTKPVADVPPRPPATAKTGTGVQVETSR